MAELTVYEQLLYSTVKVTVERGASVSTGTGFFYSVDMGDGDSIPILVSNKHVLAQGGLVKIWCHEKASDSIRANGNVIPVDINVDAGGTVEHPDPDIDLCAIFVGDILNKSSAAAKPILYLPLENTIIPDKDQWNNFDALEEVIMVGCPNGIYDTFNYNPIIRSGITATPLFNRYLGKPEFMVDMACFPGSSGSPIMLINQIGYRDKPSGNYLMGKMRIFFLGILYAGPRITSEGQIVLGQAPKVITDTMMHLGNAIRSSEMLEIERLIKVMAVSWPRPNQLDAPTA